MQWKKLDEVKLDHAIALYRSGKNCVEIATELQVSKQNIHAQLKKRGVLVKRKRKPTPPPKTPIVIPAEDRWWVEESMKRDRARNGVFQAVKSGRLIRLPCEVCGERNSEGHHDDYDKPLQVRWLCNRHHNEWHRINGKSRFTGIKRPVSES
jgi:hypothetical protein